MKHIKRWTGIGVVISSLTIGMAQAQEITPERDAAADTIVANPYLWQPLFGENLSEASYDTAAWKMENGVLTASKDDAIWTTREFENFELDIDFKTDAGTNSGVVVYSTNTKDWIPNSVEIQIADDHYDKWKEAKPYERSGAIYGHLGPKVDKVVKKPGEWNHMRIKCIGKRISVILNGKKVTDMDMSLWKSGKKNPDGSDIPAWLPKPFATLSTKGFIGLQGKHGEASISFRNLKVRQAKLAVEKK